MRGSQRGTALIETAFTLPVMLIALYGVTWGVRVGALTERAESAVRYAGVISQQQSPFDEYSFYALYNNLGATSAVNPQPCQSPPSVFMVGGNFSVLKGTPTQTAVAPAFWQPDANSLQSSCQPIPNRQTLSGSNVSRDFLMLVSVPQLSASVTDNLIIGDQTLATAKLHTSYRFYRSPDISTLMHCEGPLSNAVSVSLAPSSDTRQPVPTTPLPSTNLTLPTIAASANCANAPGGQTPAPMPSPSPTATGGQPSPGQGTPTPTPTPAPSPTPTSSPTPAVSPTPSATPSPSPTPTPTAPATGNPGGGGGSGGGGGQPTPTPSPGGGKGSPVPSPGPTGTPTGTPTVSPAPRPSPSASPTVAPATPKPTATPVPTPKPAPSPSPTSNGTIS